MRRIRSQLTYANVVATLALFIALGGGTAAALSGSNTVQSDDLGPGAQVKAPDVAAGAVGSAAVINESLTGQDIKNQSGVDTCVNTVRLGNLCFRAENFARPWLQAAQHCANLNLRLPSYTEARALATNYDLPNVDENEGFWTEETEARGPNDDEWAFVVSDATPSASGFAQNRWDVSTETVCVTTPTN
jgi:hypothetical protein